MREKLAELSARLRERANEFRKPGARTSPEDVAAMLDWFLDQIDAALATSTAPDGFTDGECSYCGRTPVRNASGAVVGWKGENALPTLTAQGRAFFEASKEFGAFVNADPLRPSDPHLWCHRREELEANLHAAYRALSASTKNTTEEGDG